MTQSASLYAFLNSWQHNSENATQAKNIVEALLALSRSAIELNHKLRNRDGLKNSFETYAQTVHLENLKNSSVAVVAMNGSSDPIIVDKSASLAMTLLPLQEAGGFELSKTLGTIFSLLPYLNCGDNSVSFLQKGREQLVAGMILYGPSTQLILTCGKGTHCFIYDPESDDFVLKHANLRILENSNRCILDSQNWHETVNSLKKSFAGTIDFKRSGFLPSDALNILLNGGVYLQADKINLVMQANPVAFLIQKAGGLSTNLKHPVLNIKPHSPEQQIRYLFGSADPVMGLHCQFEQARAKERPMMSSQQMVA